MLVYRCLNEMQLKKWFSADEQKIYKELHLKKASQCYGHNSWNSCQFDSLDFFHGSNQVGAI